MESKGLIHIYTGTGKGKTTAAIGLATRALGHNLKVCYVYFHKQPELYGYNEIQSLEKLGATVMGFAKGHPHLDKSIKVDVVTQEAKEGIKSLYKILEKSDFDLLIMDEILISVRDKFLDEKELIQFVKNKPENLELVLTGRGATDKLIELADYVSEVNKIKHPYDNKITSRKGIEY